MIRTKSQQLQMKYNAHIATCNDIHAGNRNGQNWKIQFEKFACIEVLIMNDL